MPDFIPKADADFDHWFANFQTYTAAHTAELGLSPAQALEIQTAKANWGLAYSNHLVSQDAAMAARALKETRRGEGVNIIRLYAGFIQNRRETTDAQRRFLGITVPDREPTPLDPTAILREHPPRLVLDHSNPRVVVIHFGPNPDDERRNAKPDICGGARIWYVSGSVPAGGTEGIDALPWQWLADDTNSPYNHNVGSAQTITYRAQWFDRLMNLGPLGDPVSCAVTG
jgi:hypothetical protein